MNPTWSDFLQHNMPSTDLPTDTLQNNCLMPISQLSPIQVTGSEAEKFLQGQFTNDVKQVSPNQAQTSGWCSPKGKLLVTFRLLQREEGYYLLLPTDSVENTLKRLKMYVLRSDVQFNEVNNDWVCLGIVGEQAADFIHAQLNLSVPDTVNACINANDASVLRVEGTTARFLLLAQVERAQALWQAARDAGWHLLADSTWTLFEILAGYPQINTQNADNYIPQMVNFTAVGGVNFKKGCYAGQEIVARTQYRATLKNRAYLAHIANAEPAIGTEILQADAAVGNILNVSPHPNGGCALLAVLKMDVAETGELHLATGERIELQDLPYALDV